MSRILIPNLLLLLVVVPAAADVLTSYTFEGGGNLLYAGGVSPIAQEDGVGVSGLSMLVGGSFVVNGQPTPYGCGNIVGPHCQLKLRTGNLTGINADSWFFAGGGSIALTGGVSPVLTTPDYIIPLGSNLFSGSCLSATVTHVGPANLGSMMVFNGAFPATATDDFLDLFALPRTEYLGSIRVNFHAFVYENGGLVL